MIECEHVWQAIEKLAKFRHLSCSGMARLSGLNPTAFNLSKRQSKYGKPHWPSLNTLAKMLNSSNISFAEFAKYLDEQLDKNK